MSPDQLAGTSPGSSNLVISILVSYLKTNILRDCILIEIVDNIMAETDLQVFLYLFLEYNWNRLMADVVIQGSDERRRMLQADEEVLQIS